ncbi:hypothetical protein FB451DRAFT_1177158 [Mycena latifolia]|nr:hypothetical protein FB451DRAFT_1177158 [Mycena latifolia]
MAALRQMCHRLGLVDWAWIDFFLILKSLKHVGRQIVDCGALPPGISRHGSMLVDCGALPPGVSNSRRQIVDYGALPPGFFRCHISQCRALQPLVSNPSGQFSVNMIANTRSGLLPVFNAIDEAGLEIREGWKAGWFDIMGLFYPWSSHSIDPTKVVSKAQFDAKVAAAYQNTPRVPTPAEDIQRLAYLLDLSPERLAGSGAGFRKGGEACACGRAFSILDIVNTGLQVHSKEFLVNVITGTDGYIANIGTQPFNCYTCGAESGPPVSYDIVSY